MATRFDAALAYVRVIASASFSVLQSQGEIEGPRLAGFDRFDDLLSECDANCRTGGAESTRRQQSRHEHARPLT